MRRSYEVEPIELGRSEEIKTFSVSDYIAVKLDDIYVWQTWTDNSFVV